MTFNAVTVIVTLWENRRRDSLPELTQCRGLESSWSRGSACRTLELNYAKETGRDVWREAAREPCVAAGHGASRPRGLSELRKWHSRSRKSARSGQTRLHVELPFPGSTRHRGADVRASSMSAEVPETASAEEQKEMEDKVTSPEKAEEAKLKARYPHLGQKPGGSDFLRKRLQKGQKYFDSGDYNMAKAKMKNKQLPTAAPDKTEVTGDHIPTPQDLPQRKPSLVASKLAG